MALAQAKDIFPIKIVGKPPSIPFKEFLSTIQATQSIISAHVDSKAYFDLHRVATSRDLYAAYKKDQTVGDLDARAYLTKALNPTLGAELTRQEYTRLHDLYGDSVIKIYLIDQNLKKWLSHGSSRENILAAGGACALESFQVKLIRYFQQNKSHLVVPYIQKIFASTPTWTQITGAIIPTNGLSILYDETFPWHLRIAQYGLKDAEVHTQQVYEKLFSSVSRYVKLQNQDNTLIKIPFTSLNLREGKYLLEWYNMWKKYLIEVEKKLELPPIQFDAEDLKRIWVDYTYEGPQILSLSREYIKTTHPEIYQKYNLDAHSIHVRGKQIDHLSLERSNNWLLQILMTDNIKNQEELVRPLNLPANRYKYAVSAWIRDNMQNYPAIGMAGMLDFTYEGNVMHETPLQSSQEMNKYKDEELFEEMFSSPLRLHSQNVDQVCDFLSRFGNANTFPREKMISLYKLKNKLSKTKRKIDVMQKHLVTVELFRRVLDDLIKNYPNKQSNVELSEREWSQLQSIENIQLAFIECVRRFTKDKVLNKILQEEYKLALPVHETFKRLIQQMEIIEENSIKRLQVTFYKKITQFEDRILILMNRNLQTGMEELNRSETDYTTYSSQMSAILEEVSHELVHKLGEKYINHIRILPLADNLFVSYMQQLLFIPTIRKAYIEVSQIEQNTRLTIVEKEELIVQSIRQISPVLLRCLRYVMSDKDAYPWSERYEDKYINVT